MAEVFLCQSSDAANAHTRPVLPPVSIGVIWPVFRAQRAGFTWIALVARSKVHNRL